MKPSLALQACVVAQYNQRMHFADRLLKACRQKGNAVCAGVDPRWEQLPLAIRQRHPGGSLDAMAGAIEEFSLRVLEIVSPLVPVVKPQSAFFEACGPAGMRAQQIVLARAKALGLITILDNKRGDIASTAEAYADAALAGTPCEGSRHPVWTADALTVNPYLGRDAVEPFLSSARRCDGGVFVLVRTSNKGAKQFQDLAMRRQTGVSARCRGGRRLVRGKSRRLRLRRCRRGRRRDASRRAGAGAAMDSARALPRAWLRRTRRQRGRCRGGFPRGRRRRHHQQFTRHHRVFQAGRCRNGKRPSKKRRGPRFKICCKQRRCGSCRRERNKHPCANTSLTR